MRCIGRSKGRKNLTMKKTIALMAAVLLGSHTCAPETLALMDNDSMDEILGTDTTPALGDTEFDVEEDTVKQNFVMAYKNNDYEKIEQMVLDPSISFKIKIDVISVLIDTKTENYVKNEDLLIAIISKGKFSNKEIKDIVYASISKHPNLYASILNYPNFILYLIEHNNLNSKNTNKLIKSTTTTYYLEKSDTEKNKAKNMMDLLQEYKKKILKSKMAQKKMLPED